jgi:hypothetical protein
MTITTVLDLQTMLSQYPDTAEILVETRFKTGYDEGDIYHQGVKTIQADSQGQLLIQLGGARLVGGW